nr:hypothetical protein [Mycobacterium sp. JS623]
MQFDEFAEADGPFEVQVAHGRGNAVTGTPLRGGGVGGGVDPLQQRAAIDEADVADVNGFDVKAMDYLVAESFLLTVLRG